ncbi:Sulfite reductase [NADPH] flavoprotein alpha-component [compost metagenome]
MLSESKLSLLKELVTNSSHDELIWTKGYIAGFIDREPGINRQVTNAPIAAVTVKPTIIYGTETGNSKKVASGLLASFKKNRINAKVADVFQYDIAKLEKESLVLFVISTQGEGEFPQNAQAFYENLAASSADLNKLSFAVLGLGDSSYPLFNNAGLLLDKALGDRGAKRLLPLSMADVDYSDAVVQWENELQALFSKAPAVAASPSNVIVPAQKQNYRGTITHKIVLNDIGSAKETFHIEITPEQPLLYEPGDALGILPRNESTVIERILNYFKAESNSQIEVHGQVKTASKWLEERNVLGLSKRSVVALGELLQKALPDDKADLEDLLSVYGVPDGITIGQLVSILLPISPRLYSISSSTEAHDGQIHLIVNLNKFDAGSGLKFGLASKHLADYPLGTDIEFYIHKNKNFRLPQESTDIIMIGPGTGIAPFRSFISQRDATGAQGKNWLFFGEQHFVQDFYYQTEIQDWLASGVLSTLDVAFSRDQPDKVYVQDRILEKATEFNHWLENGACLYICGQKSPMSADVESVIIEVIAAQRNISPAEAVAVLEALEQEGRYQKDVY